MKSSVILFLNIINSTKNIIISAIANKTFLVKLLEFLKKLSQEYGISDKVRFLGQVDDMQSLYRAASVFALPSRLEGFPMVLIEAMSQGCACISFEIKEAVYEIIHDRVDGLIVEDGNLTQFADRLSLILQDHSMRIKLGTAAVKNIARFSQDAFLQRWESIINNVLIKNKSK